MTAEVVIYTCTWCERSMPFRHGMTTFSLTGRDGEFAPATGTFCSEICASEALRAMNEVLAS